MYQQLNNLDIHFTFILYSKAIFKVIIFYIIGSGNTALIQYSKIISVTLGFISRLANITDGILTCA